MKWIVVADQTEAKIYRESDFSLLKTLNNSLGRLHNRALTRGRPGLAHGKSKGGVRFFSMTGGKNPHEEVAETFAKRVSDFLLAQMNLEKFDEVLIVAEPKMEGRLKAHMKPALKRRAEWLPKDLRKMGKRDLRLALESGGVL